MGIMKEFLINLPNNEKTMSDSKGILPANPEHFVIFRKFS
ncbi:hypothetical protein HMPREF9087_1082 [Enterococcus casseliflavus ATCC 12755]|uniref:Uncharacterized protein n=1 Tax=Enterococcus casseliflavus ATCC 12755 TaxID=888066 RepID=F0EI40_ENTCA|nr:hypothetical protein HMPREF9087_1082 [Enterococcus casseliflavus ATCC 12755]EPH87321.1 hypothetical protein D922_04249 [Enterococcus faecalis 06-MB-DW-09]